ncbi:hypothetical protein V6N11_068050 [Hibiscus sabdariffa]|uniref:Uncharacterized protein n=1 Tax=Hibiscus sabdariffa TaxID=183260 RepID=A0ABR2SSL5_9ROSI
MKPFSNSKVFKDGWLPTSGQIQGASEVTYWEWTWAAATSVNSNSIALSLACAGCTLPGNSVSRHQPLVYVRPDPLHPLRTFPGNLRHAITAEAISVTTTEGTIAEAIRLP